MQLFSSVPAFSIRSFTPQIFNSFYFSNPIFYNLQDSKILLALLSEDFTRELGSIDDYKPACYVCVGQIRTLGWCPWSRSTTRRIFFESSVIHLAKAPLPLPFRFPTPTFFHQSCHAYTFSLWFPSLHHSFFLSLSLSSRRSCPLSLLIFLPNMPRYRGKFIRNGA